MDCATLVYMYFVGEAQVKEMFEGHSPEEGEPTEVLSM